MIAHECESSVCTRSCRTGLPDRASSFAAVCGCMVGLDDIDHAMSSRARIESRVTHRARADSSVLGCQGASNNRAHAKSEMVGPSLRPKATPLVFQEVHLVGRRDMQHMHAHAGSLASRHQALRALEGRDPIAPDRCDRDHLSMRKGLFVEPNSSSANETTRAAGYLRLLRTPS